MSLYCYNTSANRGKCTQICRRKYKVTDLDTGNELEIDNNYVMSAADLCTIGMLPELIDTGVSILKFEGRGRPPEYVDTVISTYKEAIDAIGEGTYSQKKVKIWRKQLGTVFNRGQSKGLYMGRTFDEWAGISGSKSTKTKVQIGEVEKYYPKIKVVQIKIQAKDSVKEGEEFLITGETTGAVRGQLKNMLIDEKQVQSLKQGDVVTFKIKKKVKGKDKFFVVRDKVQ